MFAVKINLWVRIDGCPKGGIAAIDFRRAAGLDAEPDDLVQIALDATDEPICRRFAGLCNEGADLVLDTIREDGPGRGRTHHSPIGPAKIVGRQFHARTPTLDPALIARFLADPGATAGDVLAALVDEADAREAKARAEEEERRRIEDGRQAQQDRERAESRARKQADQERAARERGAWIESHGSDRLRRMHAEGIECSRTYSDERLSLDRPGWRWSNDVPGGYDDPRNVPSSALDLLDRARASDPSGKLVYWTVDHECDEDCDPDDECPKYDWAGYAVVASFLESEIVYGGPDWTDPTPKDTALAV